MRVKSSQGAIAWGISLITFPLLALPLYAVFGRIKFHGYVSLSQIKDEKIHHIVDQCARLASEKQVVHESQTETETTLTRLADLPISRFNSSHLLIDGKETFQSIFDGIDSANDYILVAYYIIKDDALARVLKNRLIRKARQNVRIYLLYDEIGSLKLSKNFIQEMDRAGIATSAFKTTQGRANRLGPWRDTHVKVTGPVVQAIQFCFLEDWYWAVSEVPDLEWCFTKAKDGNEAALLIASGPNDELETCGLMFTQVINSAKKRIWITSPYFVPDRQIIGALKLAALRGVDVRILLPEKSYHRTVDLATHSFYPNTIPIGIKLYRYMPGFLHQKVFLIDEAFAAVGTANLDNRSFRLNFELTFINFDKSFISGVEKMLDEDFSNSRVVKLEEYTQRWFPFKLASRFASLLSSIL